MKILSYDIEEWYIEKKFHGDHAERYREFENYLDIILDTLSEKNLKATFFCVGKMAVDFPYVIKKIVKQGHEIGCHSNEHLWLTKMNPQELLNDTKEAIHALQDVSGQSVESFRAPAFSIGEINKWAFEILAECGITRDSSIFPAIRDFGGFASFKADFPTVIKYNGIEIKEFPICLTEILGKRLAFSGGGYFRFFPYSYIKRELSKREYSIVYLHIGDLMYRKPKLMSRQDYEIYFKENGCLLNRIKRCLKSSLGTKYACSKMQTLLGDFSFINLQEADREYDWNNAAIINI